MRSVFAAILIFANFIAVNSALGFTSSSSFASAPEFWNEVPSKSEPFLEFIQKSTSHFDAQASFDESINFQPGLNLYNEAAQLTDLFGAQGSELCAPIAITHGFTYLKYIAGFGQLATVPDIDHDGTADSYRDKIRYFFGTCQTDRNDGTHYQQAIDCMKQYVVASGYNPYVYMVGAHANTSPPGVPLQTMQHVANVTDVRTYVGNRLMVLMGVGWYSFDAATQSWTRQGGHFFNVYGYDYTNALGEAQINLKVVNSWIDYSNRPAAQMFDTVTMTRIQPQAGVTYPAEVAYVLDGPGFQFAQKAFVEDLFVALPTK
jgi:hypothetical protein